jgi:hypothetical protein
MIEKTTIEIAGQAKAEIWRDGEWTILYVEDGGGGRTTVSLSVAKALDIAKLLRGSAISASSRKSSVAREALNGP